MRDFYMEQLVKRRNMKRNIIFIILLLAGAALTIPLIKISLIFLVVPLFFVSMAIVYYKSTDVEYEYIYFNGNIDIDKIVAKKRRKHLVSAGFHEVEVIAPTGSLEIQQYRKIKKTNYSSRKKGIQTYQMVVSHKGKRARIVFEPKEELLTEMKLAAPRKVFF